MNKYTITYEMLNERCLIFYYGRSILEKYIPGYILVKLGNLTKLLLPDQTKLS